MSSFPLLKLPALVQKEIVPYFELSDVIQLSFESSAFHRMMLYCKYKTDEISFSISEKNSIYSILYVGNFKIFVCDESFKPLKTMKICGFRTLHLGYSLPFSRAIDIFSDDPHQALDNVTRHLLNFLIVKNYTCIAVETSLQHLMNLFIWKFTKKINTIRVGTPKENQIQDLIVVATNRVTDEFALLSPDYSLNVIDPHHSYIMLSEDFEICKETYDNCNYLNAKFTNSMASSLVTLPSDCQSFMRSWLEGKLEKIISVYVEVSREFDIINVFREFETFQVDFRPTTKRTEKKTHEMCIIRSDGKPGRMYSNNEGNEIWFILDWE